jgi:signal transduction histidine kinase
MLGAQQRTMRVPGAFMAVAPLAVGLGAATLVLALPGEREGIFTLRLVFALVVAWAFVGVGLGVLARGRARWFGTLAAAVGCGLFVECWRFSELALPYTVGLLFGSVWSSFLLHMVLAFPAGRVRRRAERWFLAASYIVVLVVQPLPFLFWTAPFEPACDPCPANLAMAHADQALAEVLMGGFLGLGLLGFLGLGAWFGYRTWTARGAQRTLMTPVALSMGATLVLMMAAASTEALGWMALTRALNLAFLASFVAIPVAMLVSLLGSRAYRAEAISGLIERLKEPLGAGGLRDALAYALDDPTLDVAYWVPEQGRYVDGQGRAGDPPVSSGRARTAIEHQGRPVAVITHDARLDEEPGLVRSTGAAIGLALERERLAAALRAKVEELRASRARLVDASDAARRHIERDLHDGAQPRLVSLLLNLRLARRAAEGDGASGLLDEVERELAAILQELRALASGILPPALTDLGLEAAVTELAARMPFDVEVRVPADRLPLRVEVTAYFVIAEALTNAAKHAQAERVGVHVEMSDGRVCIEVRDDGRGGAVLAGGSGLRGLADRVDVLDGRLDVASPAGAGTTIRAELPCAS